MIITERDFEVAASIKRDMYEYIIDNNSIDNKLEYLIFRIAKLENSKEDKI